ncbi:isochorismate synthase [Croceibacterium sp. TMG7-5b_MA50]|uniref:isochorismate synthase n=1 Tax=Croceibacterium sp. TMG7-5b_MA50 TaxID=3121290 RepID=UPI0032216F5E
MNVTRESLLLLGPETRLSAGEPAEVRQPLQSALEDTARDMLAAAATGTLVAGALPFDAAQPGYLFRPAGRRGDGELPDLPLTMRPAALAIVDQGEHYAEIVAEAVRMIEGGVLTKVVLARQLQVAAGTPVDPLAVAARLHGADPSVVTFLLDLTPVSGRPHHWLVGATPELLVARNGATIRSHPLAGSARRESDAVADRAAGERLLRSDKDLREHRLVVDYIADLLSPLCSDLRVAGPALRSTATMWHLGTQITGTLRGGDGPGAAGLAALLHPTPAVGGVPRAAALDVIRRLEGGTRGLYGGAIGWTDAAGDGEWYVTLRCAEICGGELTLHAGAGIVAGSDPAAELAETGAKFAAMLRALDLAAQVPA